jgi:hypothetical protein
MERGDGIVAEIWRAAAAPGEQGIRAVDGVLRLQDAFPEFALRNWNKDPTEPRYDDADETFPDLQPGFSGLPLIGDIPEQRIDLTDHLDPLSIVYWRFEFPNDAVHSVVIENSLAGDPQRAVQAYVRLPDGWERSARDWTQQAEVKFCRDVPEQDVQELVIAISNSDWLGTLDPAVVTLEARTRRCAAWIGTVTSTWHHLVESQGYKEEFTVTRTADVSWDIDIFAASDANNADVYEPVAGGATWELHGTMTSPGTSCTESGAGSFRMDQLKLSDLNYRGRDAYLVTWTDDAGHDLYGGHGLVTSQDVKFTGTLACTSSGVSFTQEIPVSTAADWWSTGADPPFTGLPIAADGHIRGTYTSDNPPLGETSTWEWDFAPTGGE